MLRFIVTLLLLALSQIPVSFASPRGGGGAVAVRGYVRSNGTYVAPHYRSAPDGNPYNNWSTIGNVNPYTGEPGTKQPYPAHRQTTDSASDAGSAEASVPRQLREFDAPTPRKFRSQKSSVRAAGSSEQPANSLHPSRQDNELIDRACIMAKSSGPAAFNQCKTSQVEELARGPKAPNLSHLGGQERDLIDRACIMAKSSGPAAFNQCTTSQLEELARGPKAPNVSHLSGQVRELIDRACIMAKSSGPAVFNQCTTSQLAELARGPKAPNLSHLSRQERELIDRACIMTKSSGPAAFNQCTTSQVADLAREPKARNPNRL